MNPRVVLYAEGGGETSGGAPPPTPREPIWKEHFGIGHVLLSRLLAETWSLPEDAIQFIGPLRPRGRAVRGSMLRDREVMRQALTFPTRSPNFAVILVDSDGDTRRKATIESNLEGIVLPFVVAVAVPEFETWLLADVEAQRDALGAVELAEVASLAPTAAKQLLRDWCTRTGKGSDDVRRTLATLARLEVVRERCPDFDQLARELAQKRPNI